MRCVRRNDEEASCLHHVLSGIADVLERATQDKTELLVLMLMSRHRTAAFQLELCGGHRCGRNVTAREQRRELLEGNLLPAHLFGFHSAKLPQALLRQELELFIGQGHNREAPLPDDG